MRTAIFGHKLIHTGTYSRRIQVAAGANHNYVGIGSHAGKRHMIVCFHTRTVIIPAGPVISACCDSGNMCAVVVAGIVGSGGA